MTTLFREAPAPLANETVTALEASRLLSRHVRGGRLFLRQEGPAGANPMEVALPPSAINPLREILEQIGAGNGVTILPQRVELTTQEAADLLNVSRPHLVKLLDQGTIPSFRVGTHRRVRARDVAIYAEQARSASGRILDQLVAEAQELGLGY